MNIFRYFHVRLLWRILAPTALSMSMAHRMHVQTPGMLLDVTVSLHMSCEQDVSPVFPIKRVRHLSRAGGRGGFLVGGFFFVGGGSYGANEFIWCTAECCNPLTTPVSRHLQMPLFVRVWR
jgi:hypothetical protein